HRHPLLSICLLSLLSHSGLSLTPLFLDLPPPPSTTVDGQRWQAASTGKRWEATGLDDPQVTDLGFRDPWDSPIEAFYEVFFGDWSLGRLACGVAVIAVGGVGDVGPVVRWSRRALADGQPKRHLLTTGWSVFVSNKRLFAGDSVLFIRDEKFQLLLGIKRANRQQPALASSVISSDSSEEGGQGNFVLLEMETQRVSWWQL
ncbi:hypothetical protein Dimus_033670, partial [Dionaea muscipula]